jgi:hypothetical protein
MTADDLYAAVEQMNPDEADELTMRLVYLRARRKAPCLPEREEEVLRRIYKEKRPGFRERFDKLSPKMLERTLTPEEEEEFHSLIAESEIFDAHRLEAIGELANLRGIAPIDLMRQLGLKAPGIV